MRHKIDCAVVSDPGNASVAVLVIRDQCRPQILEQGSGVAQALMDKICGGAGETTERISESN